MVVRFIIYVPRYGFVNTSSTQWTQQVILLGGR